MVTMAQSATRTLTWIARIHSHTLTSTQLQPRGAKRQLSYYGIWNGCFILKVPDRALHEGRGVHVSTHCIVRFPNIAYLLPVIVHVEFMPTGLAIFGQCFIPGRRWYSLVWWLCVASVWYIIMMWWINNASPVSSVSLQLFIAKLMLNDRTWMTEGVARQTRL